jgi:16S rRNA (adenine1518-N6/adenine1519-N6)-dimethyltransferase
VIRHLLESEPRPRRIVLTIQKEVAQRICEKPGDMSLLALSVQVYGKPTLLHTSRRKHSSLRRMSTHPFWYRYLS